MSEFRQVTPDDVIDMLNGRSFRYGQVHHTYKPDHGDFTGTNHMELQRGMYNYHTQVKGWYDIAQHLTIFPDGVCVTGRRFDETPYGIAGYNQGSFMIEHVGNFDQGHDQFEGDQLASSLKIYHYLVHHCGASILFHREHANKTCPGTGVDKDQFVKAVNDYSQDTPVESISGETTPANSGYPKRGHRGSHVGDIQKQLNEYGYGLRVDNSFGPKTGRAVEQFQKRYGLKVDGIVGPVTQQTLDEALLVIDGLWGKEVTGALQRALGTIQDKVISGQYRTDTTRMIYSTHYGPPYTGSNVIVALQRLIGADVDGLIGPNTVRKLQIYLGTPVDSMISKPSLMVKEMQKQLNHGKFV